MGCVGTGVLWGFGGWNRGRFWGFLLLSRKCSISSFLNPFFIFSHLRLLIFRIFQNPRHFRTARSGVYMGAGLTDSVIRFGFLDEWGDAHFSGLIPLPRLSTRCRGAPRRRGRSGRVWDLVCKRFGCKKPQSLSAYCRKLRGSASVRSFAFGL